jgi:hypothetical protein
MAAIHLAPALLDLSRGRWDDHSSDQVAIARKKRTRSGAVTRNFRTADVPPARGSLETISRIWVVEPSGPAVQRSAEKPCRCAQGTRSGTAV